MRSIASRLRSLFFAIFALGQIAATNWQIVSTKDETALSSGVRHRQVMLASSAGTESVRLDLALFSPKTTTLRVVDNATFSEDLGTAMRREKCIAGVNGGYFDKSFKPIGLRVIDGSTTSPLTRARLLTGVICASSQGVEILRLGEFSGKKKTNAALECGPFLVDRATRVNGLDGLRKARRTFVAIGRAKDAAVGVSSAVSLAELADVLDSIPDFKVWRALNLDGGSSSAFWFRRNSGDTFSIPEAKTVRDFIAVIEPAS